MATTDRKMVDNPMVYSIKIVEKKGKRDRALTNYLGLQLVICLREIHL